MTTRTSAFLLLLVLAVPAVRAQVEPAPPGVASTEGEDSIDSNEASADETVTTSTSTTSVTTISTTTAGGVPAPSWLHLVRFSAIAGPVAFLLMAWAIGGVAHYRIVRREQALFPAIRGSRAPQTTPMFFSAALFFVPVLLFAYFEIRSRREIQLGIAGVVDEWLPVTAQAWTTLVVCLVLALVPWLLARRADTVS